MKTVGRIIALVFVTFWFLRPAVSEETERSISELDFLIGEWKGTATHYYPTNPDREKRNETVKASCEKFLNGSYIKCQTIWKSEDRPPRSFVVFYNYHSGEETFYTLFIYDNWPGISHYPIALEEDGSFFSAMIEFNDADGSVHQERIQWNFLEGKQKIVAEEHIQKEVDGEEKWLLSFDFTWVKK